MIARGFASAAPQSWCAGVRGAVGRGSQGGSGKPRGRSGVATARRALSSGCFGPALELRYRGSAARARARRGIIYARTHARGSSQGFQNLFVAGEKCGRFGLSLCDIS